MKKLSEIGHAQQWIPFNSPAQLPAHLELIQAVKVGAKNPLAAFDLVTGVWNANSEDLEAVHATMPKRAFQAWRRVPELL